MSSSQPPQIECRWCGAQFPEGAQKCPQCERPILAQTTRPAGASASAAPRLRAARRSRWPSVVAAVVGLAAIAAVVVFILRQPLQFSADMVSSTSGTYGGVPIDIRSTGTYYAKGSDFSRSESRTGSRRSILIHNRDKIWMLDPATKTYYRMFDFTPEQKAKLDAAFRQLDRKKLKKLSDRTLVGTEMVNGYLCEKRVVILPGMTRTSWMAPKLDYLEVKMELTTAFQWAGRELWGMSRQEYRNIKEHRLPSSLFEVPRDYREVPPPGPKLGQSGQWTER